MPTRPEQYPTLFAKQAKSPEVADFFRQLAGRAEVFARMHDEFFEGIILHREARDGKPFRFTKRQNRIMDRFDRDSGTAKNDLERITSALDDKTLLISALTIENQQLEFDAGMVSSYPVEDQKMAHRMLDFRRENIRLIEEFVENSPFKGMVFSSWHGKHQR